MLDRVTVSLYKLQITITNKKAHPKLHLHPGGRDAH
jgi:hypothetical protein